MSCNKLENTEGDLNLLTFAKTNKFLAVIKQETTRKPLLLLETTRKRLLLFGLFLVLNNTNNLVTPH